MRSTVITNTIKALLCRPTVPSVKTLVGALILVGATALPVLACGGGSQGALTVLTFPFVGIASFYGLPLLLNISLEAAILHYRESIGWLKSFRLSLLANLGGLAALLVGLLASFAIFSPTILLTLPLQSGILGLMLISFCRRTGCFPKLTKGLGRLGVYLTLIGISYGSLALDRIVDTSRDPAVILAPIAGLFLTGFLFNLIVEGWILSRLMSEYRPQLAATVVSMNVWSYGLLPACILLLQYIQGKPLFS